MKIKSLTRNFHSFIKPNHCIVLGWVFQKNGTSQQIPTSNSFDQIFSARPLEKLTPKYKPVQTEVFPILRFRACFHCSPDGPRQTHYPTDILKTDSLKSPIQFLPEILNVKHRGRFRGSQAKLKIGLKSYLNFRHKSFHIPKYNKLCMYYKWQYIIIIIIIIIMDLESEIRKLSLTKRFLEPDPEKQYRRSSK